MTVACPLVKANTKLPIPHICISQRDTEMEITVRYRYAANGCEWEGVFDWEGDMGHLTRSK